MASSLQPPTHHSAYGQKINRAHSPVLARLTPWVTIILGSLLATLPVIASAPVMPPLGFVVMLAWRQMHPGILPVWAGIPLGLCDDLFSGQPAGSGIMLWSLTMIVMEVVEHQFPWRSVLTDWAVASALIVAYLLLAMLIASAGGGPAVPQIIVPQMLLTVVLYPIAGRLVGWLDRLRLVRFRAFD